MMTVYGIGVGLILCCVCWNVLSLCFFLKNIEKESVCNECKRKRDCYALKERKNGQLNNVSQWMLISYMKVRKSCECVVPVPVSQRLVSCIFAYSIYLILFWSKGLNGNGILLGVVSIVLFYLAVVDWNTQYIPLECNVFICICGLIHLFADVSNWLEYVIGLIAVSGFLCIVNWIATPILRNKYQEDGQEIDAVIGDGDIKLMAATGLLLGWKLNFLALGIGCVLGSIIHLIFMKIKGSEGKFALGPYLSLGVYITMICGTQLVSWYLNVMGVMPQ